MMGVDRWMRAAGLIFSIVAFLFFTNVNEGEAAKPSDGSERVVAKVGKASITVGELQRRIAAVPPFQRKTYGRSADEIMRNYLKKVLIPELLFAQGALERGKDKDLEVRARQRDLLKTSLLLHAREDFAQKVKIRPEQIESYYNQNRDRYHAPARVSVWRILVPAEQQAKQVIKEAKENPTPKAWNELARKHSIDKSTNMRGGNLGFLTMEGISADKKTRVAPEIAKAAFAVKDGEIVSTPIREGNAFAVIWRRGSMPKIVRKLETERKTIEVILLRERIRKAQKELIEKLRKRYVKYENLEGAELIGVSAGGKIESLSKPGRIVRKPARTKPEQRGHGLR